MDKSASEILACDDSSAVPGELAAAVSSPVTAPGVTKVSEEEVFANYYMATRASLRAYLATILRDAAACEDCMQEAALVLWEKRQADWSLEDFRKLAFTCSRFKALSWLKKNKPAAHLNLSHELSEQIAMRAADAEGMDTEAQADRMRALRLCVESLPKAKKAMVMARYESAHSEELTDLARQQGRSMSAIYKQLERIRTALRACVQSKLDKWP